jgi:hypothetical protein
MTDHRIYTNITAFASCAVCQNLQRPSLRRLSLVYLTRREIGGSGRGPGKVQISTVKVAISNSKYPKHRFQWSRSFRLVLMVYHCLTSHNKASNSFIINPDNLLVRFLPHAASRPSGNGVVPNLFKSVLPLPLTTLELDFSGFDKGSIPSSSQPRIHFLVISTV